MIAIINYGAANLTSVATTFRKAGADVVVTSSPEELTAAEKLVLPGVGAFDPAMRRLRETGLASRLDELVLGQKKPILGICLGLQLFTQASEEGDEPGLGWIDARTRCFHFDAGLGLKVPHIGWNEIHFRKDHAMIAGLASEPTVYFAHSYYVDCTRREDILATTHYGHEFASAVQVGNIVGIQFHPEKSHALGKTLIENFLGAC